MLLKTPSSPVKLHARAIYNTPYTSYIQSLIISIIERYINVQPTTKPARKRDGRSRRGHAGSSAETMLLPTTVVPEDGAPPLPRAPAPLARRFQQVCATMVAEAIAGEDVVQLEYGSLIALEIEPGIDQRRLADAMGIDPSNASLIVDRLHSMGLIERRVNGADRRSRDLYLTPKGKALWRRLRVQSACRQRNGAGAARARMSASCFSTCWSASSKETGLMPVPAAAAASGVPLQPPSHNSEDIHARVPSLCRALPRVSRFALARRFRPFPAFCTDLATAHRCGSSSRCRPAPAPTSPPGCCRAPVPALGPARRRREPPGRRRHPRRHRIPRPRAIPHLLLLSFAGIISINPLIHEQLPYDPARDLVPIVPVADNFLGVSASASIEGRIRLPI